MKRSRTGCQVCRSRRIKCDETRPQCLNCVKKQLQCNYEIRFQWMFQTFPHFEDANKGKRKGNRPLNTNALGARTGPTSRKRKIGQEVVGFPFRHPLRTLVNTEMIESDFDSDDDPICAEELNDKRSLEQFKKFRIVRRDANTSSESSITQPHTPPTMLIPSPLLRPIERGYQENIPAPLGSDYISPPALQLGPSEAFKPPPFMGASDILVDMSENDLVDHFINVTADELVPIPYEENPFLRLLPQLAQTDVAVREVLVAYAATHKANLLHGIDQDPAIIHFKDRLVNRCIKRLNSMQAWSPNTDRALLIATMIALIEIDRGNPSQWYRFMSTALDIVKSRPTFASWDLSIEINSMTFRLLGYMCGIGNLWLAFGSSPLLTFPSWPEWTGSLDYLTGIDLNLLPLFSETARLIQIRQHVRLNRRELSIINGKALRVIQRLNDYWLEEYWPDSDITAMCIMFQEALQLHILRRVIGFRTEHPEVQRIVSLMMCHIEQWIAVSSTMQRCMTFILTTVASEALKPEQRVALLMRLNRMAQAGFAYNYQVCEDIRKHWSRNTSLIVSPESTLVV